MADRSDSSTKKDTRNGLGKSTLVDIIDFCLGSSTRKEAGLCIEPLKGWAFTLELTLAGNRVRVTRSIASPNRFVVEGSTTGWIEQPDEDEETGEHVFKLERWKKLLGWALFGLPSSDDVYKYKPSYRSLISYFIRKGIDAYSDPFRYARQQQPWNIQVNVGFLLGLNWDYASKWQELKDLEKGVQAISNAIKTGALEGPLGSVGELEAERIQLESQVEQEKKSLSSFKVHPQYESIQEEADHITAEIHVLTNENVVDRRRLARYQESVGAEKPPSDIAIDKLYEETGITFPDSIQRTLSEAKEFHTRVVANRKGFLEAEMVRLERRIQERADQIQELTETRASSMEILRTHGALQEMTKLQERHLEKQGRLDRLKARISEIKDLTSRKRDLRVSKAELAVVAARDHEQRRDRWSAPVRIFNDNSQALYKTPGRLVIDIAETGFKYDVEINRSGSEGVGKMKVFCFDLMLLQYSSLETHRLDFLIHDSALYDGVDSRQRALALELANEVARSIDGQYICTMNSDMVPRDDFTSGFNFDQFVRLTLTDKTPSDSLLGFRFERPRV